MADVGRGRPEIPACAPVPPAERVEFEPTEFGRAGQITAYCDRIEPDREDLLQLKPTIAELDEAIEWVKNRDGHPNVHSVSLSRRYFALQSYTDPNLNSHYRLSRQEGAISNQLCSDSKNFPDPLALSSL
jgi:hypothetical protein